MKNDDSFIEELIYIDLAKLLRDKYKISRLDAICIASDFFDKYREKVDESDCESDEYL